MVASHCHASHVRHGRVRRRIRIEERLRVYLDDLRKRHPVRILDARLREVSLPPPPARPGG